MKLKEKRLQLLKDKFKDKKPLICYFMAGYPTLNKSLDVAKTLIENGADILEIGVPFSDPVADGTTIQVAHEKAVKDGITILNAMELAKSIKDIYKDIPLVLMTYYNPIFVYGEEEFCLKAKECGIDGIIVPDLPPEEATDLKNLANKNGISVIFLAAPTSNMERVKLIGDYTDSFIYYVSLTGITGARDKLPWEELEQNVSSIKEITQKPVVVGFGVSKKEHTEKLSRIADGVVVGSAIVKLQGSYNLEGLKDLVKDLKSGLKS